LGNIDILDRLTGGEDIAQQAQAGNGMHAMLREGFDAVSHSPHARVRVLKGRRRDGRLLVFAQRCGIQTGSRFPMSVERHLILVHTFGDQEVEDFQDIAGRVRQLAPDIEVFIAENDLPCSVTRRQAAKRPTLIFSPSKLLEFRPMRGKIYAGSPIPKLEQVARFKAAGVPVPESVEITPDVVLPEEMFGLYVVVKPGFSQSSYGQDITLMRREAVRFRPRETYPHDHPGRQGPMYAQRFIDTGPFVNHYRVLTLFGEPLLAFKTTSQIARPPLDSSDEVLATIRVKATRKTGPITRDLFRDPEIFAMAQRCYAALPEIPLQAVDMVKAADTGRLFVLEANPGGNTWIFSKSGPAGPELKKALGVERLTDQFDAFAVVARTLVNRTRAEAE
jgi:hypothetical protein